MSMTGFILNGTGSILAADKTDPTSFAFLSIMEHDFIQTALGIE